MQWRRTYKVIGGITTYPVLCGNSGHKISSKMQNERWVGTSRRSICDSDIFQKYSPEYPGKPRNLAENPLENPGKEFHFTVGHPGMISFCHGNAQKYSLKIICLVFRNSFKSHYILSTPHSINHDSLLCVLFVTFFLC